MPSLFWALISDKKPDMPMRGSIFDLVPRSRAYAATNGISPNI